MRRSPGRSGGGAGSYKIADVDSRLSWLTLIPAKAWFRAVILTLATHPEDQFFLGLGICTVALSMVSALRFMDLRQKRTRIGYEMLPRFIFSELPNRSCNGSQSKALTGGNYV